MKYIEAPDDWIEPGKGVFLAGGISGCPDWQAEMFKMLGELMPNDWTAINPRRKVFDQSVTGEEQIDWEYIHMRRATAISFWFPCETLCPIVLFELGTWLMRPDKPIFIGAHPEYKRMIDITQQIKLARRELIIEPSLERLAERIARSL